MQPAPKRTFEFAAGNDEAGVPEPVTHVRFLPGSDGRLVLAVQQNRVVCWEVPLGGEDAFVVAEGTVPGGTICDVLVNEDPTNPATVVVAWARRPPYHPCVIISHCPALSPFRDGANVLPKPVQHLQCDKLRSKHGTWTDSMAPSSPSAPTL